MAIGSVDSVGGAPVGLLKASDKVEDQRKKKEDVSVESKVAEKKQIPPEELLKQIKGLTEDGVYSVRFEVDDTVGDLVVKIVDRESDEVIRQVPAEEVMELRESLDDLRGNLVDTKS